MMLEGSKPRREADTAAAEAQKCLAEATEAANRATLHKRNDAIARAERDQFKFDREALQKILNTDPLQTLAESVAQGSQEIDAKLSEYYGITQIQDEVVFVTLYPRAGSIQIAGDFNDWQPAASPMRRVGETGVWQAKMKLPRGIYRYRLVVDGQWQKDPYNKRSEMNPYGEDNSILEVK